MLTVQVLTCGEPIGTCGPPCGGCGGRGRGAAGAVPIVVVFTTVSCGPGVWLFADLPNSPSFLSSKSSLKRSCMSSSGTVLASSSINSCHSWSLRLMSENSLFWLDKDWGSEDSIPPPSSSGSCFRSLRRLKLSSRSSEPFSFISERWLPPFFPSSSDAWPTWLPLLFVVLFPVEVLGPPSIGLISIWWWSGEMGGPLLLLLLFVRPVNESKPMEPSFRTRLVGEKLPPSQMPFWSPLRGDLALSSFLFTVSWSCNKQEKKRRRKWIRPGGDRTCY